MQSVRTRYIKLIVIDSLAGGDQRSHWVIKYYNNQGTRHIDDKNTQASSQRQHV